ncbi:hypothetical protein FRC10_001326 [Ceratobasidium sp. 414]|nr:hypothetical protein FRC10_001326 [Ceratobasidium sp. 414]
MPVATLGDSDDDVKKPDGPDPKDKGKGKGEVVMRGQKRKLDNKGVDKPGTSRTEETPEPQVLIDTAKAPKLPKDATLFNHSLRIMKDGWPEGTSPKYPADEDKVVMLAEKHLIAHIDEIHRVIRTITNFRFVSAKNPEKMVTVGIGKSPVDQQDEPTTHLISLVATGSINWEMGQRAQAGFWFIDQTSLNEQPCELIWMRIPVETIQLMCPPWWRDGETYVVVVWSGRGVYVLQGADLPYSQRHAACSLKHNLPGLSKPVDVMGFRPDWFDATYWPGLQSDFRRMRSKYPQNTGPPPVPQIDDSTKRSLKLEGQIAERVWQIQHKAELVKTLRMSQKPIPASKRAIPKYKQNLEKIIKESDRNHEDVLRMEQEIQELRVKLKNLSSPPIRTRPSARKDLNKGGGTSRAKSTTPPEEKSPAPPPGSPPPVSLTPPGGPPTSRVPSVPPRDPSVPPRDPSVPPRTPSVPPRTPSMPPGAPRPQHSTTDALVSPPNADTQVSQTSAMDIDTDVGGGTETTPTTADIPLDPALFGDAQASADTSTDRAPSEAAPGPARRTSGTSPSSSQALGAFNQSTPPLQVDHTAFGLQFSGV